RLPSSTMSPMSLSPGTLHFRRAHRSVGWAKARPDRSLACTDRLPRCAHAKRTQLWPRGQMRARLQRILDVVPCAFAHPTSSRARASGADRPQRLDAPVAHADIPIVQVDGRIAVARDQPDLVAELQWLCFCPKHEL